MTQQKLSARSRSLRAMRCGLYHSPGSTWSSFFAPRRADARILFSSRFVSGMSGCLLEFVGMLVSPGRVGHVWVRPDRNDLVDRLVGHQLWDDASERGELAECG